jgi:hypothetical protein
VAVLGLVVEYLGATWDIAWHSDLGRDTFFTPPHLLIVTGGVILGVGTSLAIALGPTYAGRGRLFGHRPGLALAAWAAAFQGIALGVDNWWHGIFGVDVQLWSPPHLLLFFLGVLASIGILADYWRGPAKRPWVMAVVTGILMGNTTAFVQEYTYGFPHFRVLWYGLTLAIVFGFWISLARRTSELRWAGTIAGVTALLVQVVGVALNVVMARSAPAPAIGLVAGGVLFDALLALWPRAVSRRWVQIVAIAPAWVGAAIVESNWLRAFGRVWWPDGIFPSVVVGGGAAALISAGLGVVLAEQIRRSPGLRGDSQALTRSLVRALIVVAASLLLIGGTGALLAALSPTATVARSVAIAPRIDDVRAATLWRDGGRLRLGLMDAGNADWVSVFSSRGRQDQWAGGLTWDGTYMAGTADTTTGFIWYAPGGTDGAWSGSFSTSDGGPPVPLLLVKTDSFPRAQAPVWLERTAYAVVSGLVAIGMIATAWVLRRQGAA